MGNGERSGSGSWSDWRVRLATGVGTAAGAALGLFVIKPLVDIPGFWPGLIAFVAVTGVGGVLGRLVGGLLFRPSPGGPPNPPPPA
jgi:pantoate kinase